MKILYLLCKQQSLPFDEHLCATVMSPGPLTTLSQVLPQPCKWALPMKIQQPTQSHMASKWQSRAVNPAHTLGHITLFSSDIKTAHIQPSQFQHNSFQSPSSLNT